MSAKLPETWRRRTATLRERLSPEQLEALRRARSGYPPETLLGWHLASDTGSLHEPTLSMIEGVAQTLSACFPWDAPADVPSVGRQWVDLRHETHALTDLVSELREATAAGRIESALIRAMALGTMFARMAYLVLDGELIASAAASQRALPKTRPQIAAAQDERRSVKDIELSELLKEDREAKHPSAQRSDSAVARRMAPKFAAWAKDVGEKPLSVRSIRKWLADQKTLAKSARGGQ